MTQAPRKIYLKSESPETIFKRSVLLIVTIFCLLGVLFFSNNSYAAGTQAGSIISSIATVHYEMEGIVQSPTKSSPEGNSLSGISAGQVTQFKVDRKIDLVLTGNSNANVVPGDYQSEVTFTLTNEGNDNQEFELTPNTSLHDDDFDIRNCTTTITSVTGAILPGVTLPSTDSIKLAPDQQASISIKCDVPLFDGLSPIATGDISLISLNALAKKNDDDSMVIETITADIESGIETVFADSAGIDDAARDASHSARRTYTATLGSTPPTLSIKKTLVEMKDPDGGNQSISGSEVRYKIKVVTEGVGEINDVVITDTTPAGMHYKTETMLLDDIHLSDEDDGDKGDFSISSTDTVTINLGTITAGNDHEIQLTYIIDAD